MIKGCDERGKAIVKAMASNKSGSASDPDKVPEAEPTSYIKDSEGTGGPKYGR